MLEKFKNYVIEIAMKNSVPLSSFSKPAFLKWRKKK